MSEAGLSAGVPPRPFGLAVLMLEAEDTIALQRFVEGDEGEARRTVVWCHSSESPERARELLAFMRDRPERWTLWTRMAEGLGGEQLTETLLAADAAARASAEARAAAEMAAQMEERERARSAEVVQLYCYRDGRRFGLRLAHHDGRDTIWKIDFAEMWERDRVVDWMRWQQPCFQEWRLLLEAQPAREFERMVLEQMLRTEREVRKAGLGCGGRRPLRFWRGDR